MTLEKNLERIADALEIIAGTKKGDTIEKGNVTPEDGTVPFPEPENDQAAEAKAEEEKKAKKREADKARREKQKAEKEAAKKVDPLDDEEEEKITMADLRREATAAAKRDRDAVVALVEEFGVDKVSKIPADKIEEAYERVQAI